MQWVGYQNRFLADHRSQICVVKSRRIGFSEVVSFRCACRAAGLDYIPGPPASFRRIKPVPQNIISAGHEQAKDMLARAGKHLRALEMGYGGKKLIANEGKTEITLTNGVRMKAFSSYPATIRGSEGDVVLDEFSAVRDQPGVWAAAAALRTANLGNRDGYKLVVVFTPLGDANMSYQIAKGEMRRAFGQHRITIHDAVADGFPLTKDDPVTGLKVPATIEDYRAEYADPALFSQEFECDFMSASDRYIPEHVYNGACYDAGQLPGGYNDIGATQDYGGLDIARSMDMTAFCRLGKHVDTLWQAEKVEVLRAMKRDENYSVEADEMSWPNQRRWVDARMQTLTRMAVDASSLGTQFAEELEARWPGRIDSVKFSSAVKEELASGLKLGLQGHRIRVRSDDTDLRREVLSMRREITKIGTMRYDTPRDKGSHGDRAWALALAVAAAGGVVENRNAVPVIHTRTAESTERPFGAPRRGGLWGR